MASIQLQFPNLTAREGFYAAAGTLGLATLAESLQRIAPSVLETGSKIFYAAPDFLSSAAAYLTPFVKSAFTTTTYALPLVGSAFVARKVTELAAEKLGFSEKVTAALQSVVSNAAMGIAFYALSAPTLALAVSVTVWNARILMLSRPTRDTAPKLENIAEDLNGDQIGINNNDTNNNEINNNDTNNNDINNNINNNNNPARNKKGAKKVNDESK